MFPGNPMPEERLNEIIENAEKFGESFGKEYAKMFALGLFKKIKADYDGERDGKVLQYRDWRSIERPDVFRGECNMRSGEGPGTFGRWSSVYIVEQRNYNLAVYASQQACESGKNPKKTIRTCGYSVESDPSDFYRHEMRKMSGGLGLSGVETEKLSKFSQFSWALSHPYRTNYIFQLHRGAGGGMCCCLAGEEDSDAGAEFADKREKYLDVFRQCTSYSSPRDLNSVTGRAFAMTVTKFKAKFENMEDFDDDGEESQILTDMMMVICLTPVQEGILHDLVGPVSIKLALWYKTRGIVHKALQKIADIVWSTAQKVVQAATDKIEPQLKKGMEPVLRVKDKVEGKLREKLINKMGNLLKRYVTPYIEDALKAFDAPLTRGFNEAIEVFKTKVKIDTLPDNSRQRNLELDQIPRSDMNVVAMETAAAELVEPLRNLRDRYKEVFGEVDADELKNQAQMSIFETLDAGIFTLELRMDEGGEGYSLHHQTLQALHHDTRIAKIEFVKETVKSLLIMVFRKAIDPVAQPVIESLDDMIPEDVKDFISVAALFEEMVDFFVGEPIAQMVEGAYPPQSKRN